MQLQIEDLQAIIGIAKTAKIDVDDAVGVGQLIQRLELAVSFGMVQMASQQGPTPPPAASVPDKDPAVTDPPS
jgi:hypothetical protein